MSQISQQTQAQTIDQVLQLWPRYFSFMPESPQEYKETDFQQQLVLVFVRLFAHQKFTSLIHILKEQPNRLVLRVSFPQLTSVQEQSLQQEIVLLKQVLTVLETKPLIILAGIQLAIHAALARSGKSLSRVKLQMWQFPERRVSGHGEQVDSFVQFKGVVLSSQKPILGIEEAEMQCQKCSKIMTKHFFQGTLYNNRCETNGCGSTRLDLQKDSIKSRVFYKARVRDLASGQQLQCLSQDQPFVGQTSRFTGVLRVMRQKSKGKLYSHFLIVNCIAPEEVPRTMPFQADENVLFGILMASVAPAVSQHFLAKYVALLAMAGKVEQVNGRGQIRALVIGDPAQGHIQLLRSVKRIMNYSQHKPMPNIDKEGLHGGSFMCSPLTILQSLSQMKQSGQLTSTLSTNRINMAKQGMQLIGQLEGGLLVGGSSCFGIYDKSKDVIANLKVSRGLLECFDLWVLMPDVPDPQRDLKFAQKLFQIRENKKRVLDKMSKSSMFSQQSNFSTDFEPTALSNKLRMVAANPMHIWQSAAFASHLSIVAGISPKLTLQAATVLKQFFLILKENMFSSSFFVTTRTLASLIRFTLARAKVVGRDIATREDAIQVTKAFQECLLDLLQVGGRGGNAIQQALKDRSKGEMPVGQLSLPKQTKIFLNSLGEQAQRRNCKIFQFAQMFAMAKNLGLKVGDFGDFIQKLNNEGKLLAKGGRRYQITSVFL